MYMANARNLRLGPNTTYILLTHVGGFALGDAKNLRHPPQEIPTCWYFFALGNAKVLSFALGVAKVPNANGFAWQWNIGLRDCYNFLLPIRTGQWGIVDT